MFTYCIDKLNYAETFCLSKDDKREGIGAFPNGSKLTEIDSGNVFRFNGETGKWIQQGKRFPVSLSAVGGKYNAVFSDGTDEDVTPEIVDGKAVYLENGVQVSCDVETVKKSRKKG